MREIIAHLNTDAQLANVLKTISLSIPPPHHDVYIVLMRSVVEQQLSLKAAATIWNRFLAMIDGYPSPEIILDLDIEKMRACGLSYQKAGYLKNIAEYALHGNLNDAYIQNLDDKEAILHLTKIKGVGRWTAEMILMFSLGRPDIFPVDDLVIRQAMISLYGVTSEKRKLITDLESIAEAWRPYRSYACFALWEWKDKK